MTLRTIIFANGYLPDPKAARRLIRSSDLILAADGGTRHALAMGITPTCVIGDLDSLSEEARKLIVEQGAFLLSYPPAKDQTDLELALDYALQRGSTEIRIVGALGGRVDQTLANLSLLTDPRLREMDVRLDDGVEEAFFVHRRAEIHGKAGEIVSLIPWGAPVLGITTEGLKWPLRGQTLFPEKTRGISNVMLDRIATVQIETGWLLCVHIREPETG